MSEARVMWAVRAGNLWSFAGLSGWTVNKGARALDDCPRDALRNARIDGLESDVVARLVKVTLRAKPAEAPKSLGQIAYEGAGEVPPGTPWGKTRQAFWERAAQAVEAEVLRRRGK